MTFVRDVLGKAIYSSIALRRLSGADNAVLLTFDDGPHPEVTPVVLDLLQEHQAKALFFIPGRRIARAEHLLERIIAEGHHVGNHSFVHSNDRQPGFFSYWRDIRKCQDEIEMHCHIRPRHFRPPCGILSFTTLITPLICGLTTVMWSIDMKDWQCRDRAEASDKAERMLQVLEPGDIILLHDDHAFVVDILRRILPELRRRGILCVGTPENEGLRPSPSNCVHFSSSAQG